MAGKTILIIDTDTETIQKIMSTLESEGYLVFSASSKEVSITMANKVKPSLIFINVGLSGASGLEICKTIHDAEALGSVPIVMITPHGGAIDPRYTSLYGIVDFLKKPFTPEELISKAENVLSIESGAAQTVEEAIAELPVEEALRAELAEEEIDFQLFEEEGAEAAPLGEKIKAEPIKDETDIEVEGKRIKGEPARERIEAKAAKEKTEIKPAEDELETLLLEEEVESREVKEAETVEKKESVQRVAPEKTSPDKNEIEKMWGEGESKQEKAEQVPQEEPEENFPEAIAAREETRAYMPRRRIRERGRRSRLLVPLVVLLVIVAGAGGVILYKGFFWQKTEVRAPIIVKPAAPVPPPAQVVEPSQEIEKPQETQEAQKTVEVSKPAPAVVPRPSPAPAVKPPVGEVYSVQIGVFKSETNAAALSKKYKEKGYDAFTHKSTIKNKGSVYRVLIGKFGNRREAVKLADTVRDKEKVATIIFHE